MLETPFRYPNNEVHQQTHIFSMQTATCFVQFIEDFFVNINQRLNTPKLHQSTTIHEKFREKTFKTANKCVSKGNRNFDVSQLQIRPKYRYLWCVDSTWRIFTREICENRNFSKILIWMFGWKLKILTKIPRYTFPVIFYPNPNKGALNFFYIFAQISECSMLFFQNSHDIPTMRTWAWLGKKIWIMWKLGMRFENGNNGKENGGGVSIITVNNTLVLTVIYVYIYADINPSEYNNGIR